MKLRLALLGVAFMFAVLLLWAAGAFIGLEPNLLRWSDGGRFTFVAIFFFILLVFALCVSYIVEFWEDDKC